MLYLIKSYLTFLIKSSNQHGIHSPFVYDLLTKCFYDKKQYPEYKILKSFRDKLIYDQDIIEITDFGEGSRVFKSNLRKVSDIAKNAGVSAKRQKLLFRIVNYFSSENILELGTSLGLATAALALGNTDFTVNTIEGCQNTSDKAKDTFKTFQINNIDLHTQNFQEFFKNDTSKYDLVYIDGNHNKEHTLAYFKILLDRVEDNSVLIFDDIYWSKAMTEAWNEIYQHPKVTLSIDTFYWGIIFFRAAQKKQHFTIRL